MIAKFILELGIGIIGVIAALLFGEAGFAALALLVIHPFIGHRKADEHEFHLFYKAGNITAGLTLLALVVIYYTPFCIPGAILFKDHWLMFAVFSFLIAHGLSGLLVFRKG